MLWNRRTNIVEHCVQSGDSRRIPSGTRPGDYKEKTDAIPALFEVLTAFQDAFANHVRASFRILAVTAQINGEMDANRCSVDGTTRDTRNTKNGQM